MSTEIFYYRDELGSSAVQDFLDALEDRDRARCLAHIDLLEGDELPAKMDRAIEDSQIRVLSTHAGRATNRFVYIRRGDQTILIDAGHGKVAKIQHRVHRDDYNPLLTDLNDASLLRCDRMKSHREHVAEITLSDPTLAALYARAREHAQFAAAVARLRIACGFTVDALAERTGLSRRRVQSMERGRLPKMATMRRLVDALQARIVISPGLGIAIEPFTVEIKRPPRARKAAAPPSGPSLTITDAR